MTHSQLESSTPGCPHNTVINEIMSDDIFILNKRHFVYTYSLGRLVRYISACLIGLTILFLILFLTSCEFSKETLLGKSFSKTPPNLALVYPYHNWSYERSPVILDNPRPIQLRRKDTMFISLILILNTSEIEQH